MHLPSRGLSDHSLQILQILSAKQVHTQYSMHYSLPKQIKTHKFEGVALLLRTGSRCWLCCGRMEQMWLQEHQKEVLHH